METREVFWALQPSEIVLFYLLGTVAILVFLYGVLRHLIKYRRGRPLAYTVDLRRGVALMVSDILTHRTVRRRDRLAGMAHAGIFFGFLFGAIGTTLIFIDVDIVRPLFDFSFWRGWFYLGFSLVLDLGHFALVLGLLAMMWRRGFLAMPKLDYRRKYRHEKELRPVAAFWRVEDWLFMSALLLVELTGFMLEGARLHMEQPAWAAWSPIGNLVAEIYALTGISVAQAADLRSSSWWLHGAIALAFTAAIPWYKAKHMLAVLGSLSLRDPMALRRLPKEEAGAANVGIASVSDFSFKDMLNFDACTKCGRCHEACPATNSDYPLSPRDLVLDLRLHNDRSQGKAPQDVELLGDIIAPETLWACRTCAACQEVCPVGIEHPSMIVRMRRQLVEQGDMDPLLQATLGTIGDTGNSFGESPRKRAAWTQKLDFPVKDIREEPAETLWFVGDYASFDPRNQEVSRTVARLLRAAGVDFALLHEGEWSAGNDVRRVGEEGLYETLVEHNLEQMKDAREFSQILTTDPHSFNTIRNEYPEFGATSPIEHYATTLSELLRSGRLVVEKPLRKRVTFHDPCHLGRLNGGYDAPRDVLRMIGCEIVEMPRNRDNSFCCGAGGGRIWIPDQPGEKPSENRMHEAAALGAIDVFVTCCPKDLTMFEDARKTSGHEDDFVVEDLAELVAEAVQLKAISTKELPSLADRITEAVASRIADVVAARLDEVITRRLGSRQSGSGPMPPALHRDTAEPSSETDILKAAAGRAAEAEFGLRDGSQDRSLAPVPPAENREEAFAPEHPEETRTTTPRAESVPLRKMDWQNLAPVEAAVFEAYDIPPKEGPRILVAIKHAAVLGDEFSLTDDGCDVRSEYLEFVLNEWDDAALEEALQLTEAIGSGEVVAVAIGSEDAETSLRKALAKGAHRAVRVWSEDLWSADPVTIARGLAGVARLENPDLILTGVQSADHAHGATGTALARILGLPHAAVVVGCEWDGESKLTLTRELEGGTLHTFQMNFPALLTIQTGINKPRYATMRMIKQAKRKPLIVLDGAAVQNGSGGYHVRRMYTPETTKAEMLPTNPKDVAEFIARMIREKAGG